jgi:hypothetical protein
VSAKNDRGHVAAERRPASLTIVTLDDRLEAAALKEGFSVVVPDRRAPERARHLAL